MSSNSYKRYTVPATVQLGELAVPYLCCGYSARYHQWNKPMSNTALQWRSLVLPLWTTRAVILVLLKQVSTEQDQTLSCLSLSLQGKEDLPLFHNDKRAHSFHPCNGWEPGATTLLPFPLFLCTFPYFTPSCAPDKKVIKNNSAGVWAGRVKWRERPLLLTLARSLSLYIYT